MGMSREEAIEELKTRHLTMSQCLDKEELHKANEALDMAIKALEQEQSFKWCTGCKEYDQENHCCHRWSKVIRDAVKALEQESVIDRIRAEIEQYQSDYDVHGTEYDRTAWKAFNRCLQIIDKYKAESEPQESEETDG